MGGEPGVSKSTHTFYLISEADGLFTPDYMVFALVAD